MPQQCVAVLWSPLAQLRLDLAHLQLHRPKSFSCNFGEIGTSHVPRQWLRYLIERLSRKERSSDNRQGLWLSVDIYAASAQRRAVTYGSLIRLFFVGRKEDHQAPPVGWSSRSVFRAKRPPALGLHRWAWRDQRPFCSIAADRHAMLHHLHQQLPTMLNGLQ